MIKNFSEIYNDGTYFDNNPNWGAEDSLFKATKILDILNRNDIPLQSICEVGCGSGEILVQLGANLSPSVNFLGLDISKEAINIAKKKETSNLKFEDRDIITNHTNQDQYDLILVMDVIEHVENYFEFLRGIIAKSKYTIFHIPLDMCIWSLFRENMLLESKTRVGHIHVFTEKFVKSVLEDCGYKIIDSIFTEPIFKPATTKQKIVEFLRRIIFKLNKRFCSKTIGGMSILILAENHN